MQRVRNEVCRQREKGMNEFDGACEHIANYFEELGTFVKIGALPEDILWDVQSWNIEHYWAIFEEGILKEREECKEDVYCEFEQMFRQMREASQAGGVAPADESSIRKFIKREIRMTKACLELKKDSGWLR